MSDRYAARRAKMLIKFDGVDITDDIAPYFLAGTYIDNDDGQSDDLQITLQDRDKVWLFSWLQDAVNAAAGDNLKITATIWTENWNGGGSDGGLDCGVFELDSVTSSGPPNTVTIKATSLPYSSQIRQTKKSKSWEKLPLSAIAAEMAGSNGMGCGFDCDKDPFYDHVEQYRQSDIDFLSKLCSNAGLNLKATNNSLYLYDQSIYEQREPVIIADVRDTSFTKWKLYTSQADTVYASCRVSYVNPATGACIEGVAYTADYNEESSTNQQLEIYTRVSSAGEAKAIAEKSLRLHNKFEKRVQFTHTGHLWYVAGCVIEVIGYGFWDGKYLCTQAKHTVGSDGYMTEVTGRRILEGY